MPTLQRPMESPLTVASVSDWNTNLIAPSEIVEETQHPTGSDFSDGEPVLGTAADSSATVRPEVASASSVAGPLIDPVDDIDEESSSDSDTDSDNISDEESNHDSDSYSNYSRESFHERYRRKWVRQSATQTENKFKCISRASLFLKSPFPHSLRAAKWNRLSRFHCSGHTPVEVLLYHPLLRTLPVLPSAFRGSWIN